MLNLKITHCIKGSCNHLEIYDITPKNNTTNEGWGAPGVLKNQISSAVVTVLHQNGSLNITENITALVQGTVASFEPFKILDNLSDLEDGLITVTYSVVNAGITYSTTYRFFNICKVTCCVSKFWKQFVEEGCNCPCSNAKSKKAMEAMGLLNALESLTSCLNLELANKVLKQLETICKLSNCNCK